MNAVRLEPPAELDMPIGEAMFTQRAIRRLDPNRPIGDAQIELMLNAASKAPNGGNAQPGRFLVIRDRELIKRFGKLYHQAWWAKRRDELG
jgi:nitroreductase